MHMKVVVGAITATNIAVYALREVFSLVSLEVKRHLDKYCESTIFVH